MDTYLIVYGADSEMATFEANSPAHAVEQFVNAEMVSPNEGENRDAVVTVSICIDVNASSDGVGYAKSSDGSWFGLDDLAIVFVPEEFAQHADDVEDYLMNAGEEV